LNSKEQQLQNRREQLATPFSRTTGDWRN